MRHSQDTGLDELAQLYNYAWERFTEAYTYDTQIPPTYARELYPWLGYDRKLRTRLIDIFETAQYDEKMQNFLDMVHVYAKPLHPPTPKNAHLIYLPTDSSVEAAGSIAHRIAYRELDRFLDSVDIIMSAAREVGFTRPNYTRFLADVHTPIMFGHIGKYMRLVNPFDIKITSIL